MHASCKIASRKIASRTARGDARPSPARCLWTLCLLALCLLSLGVRPASAQSVNFQGSAQGGFNGAAPANTAVLTGSSGGTLTFVTGGAFNETTSNGFLGLSSGQLGTLQLTGPASGTSSFAGSTFTLLTTFTAPSGATPGTSTFVAPLTGSVTGTSNGGVQVTFSGPAQGFTFNGGTFTFQPITVSVNNGAPAQAISAVITANTALRINAGGPAYTDKQGNVWLADTDFVGGFTFSVPQGPIANTSDPALYADVRYGSNFSYVLPVPNGNYTLKLYFAEVYYGLPGQRLFNVSVNGTPKLTNFDVVAAAGGPYHAVEQDFSVTAAGNSGVTVTFTGVQNQAMVSALQLVPAQ